MIEKVGGEQVEKLGLILRQTSKTTSHIPFEPLEVTQARKYIYDGFHKDQIRDNDGRRDRRRAGGENRSHIAIHFPRLYTSHSSLLRENNHENHRWWLL